MAERWVMAHPPGYQELAEYLLDNITRITQAEFEVALKVVSERLNSTLGDRPYAVLLPDKESYQELGAQSFEEFSENVASGDWVLDLAIEGGLRPPAHCLGRAHTAWPFEREAFHWCADRDDIKDIVILDDHSLSGSYVVEALKGVEAFHARGGRTFVVVPHITNHALAELKEQSPETKVIYFEIVPLAIEVLKRDVAAGNRDAVRYLNQIIELYSEDAQLEDSVLTYWDHKLPDNCFGSGGDHNIDLLHGYVPPVPDNTPFEMPETEEELEKLEELIAAQGPKPEPLLIPFISGANDLEVYRTRAYYDFIKAKRSISGS
ncbi:MAG: hypothetical protein J5J00_12095 [Deltaproteobacteria bacterium]|nr:hypothetical protein [Deltaproteobacteria bacterium]